MAAHHHDWLIRWQVGLQGRQPVSVTGQEGCMTCLHVPFQAAPDEACRYWFGVRSCGQEDVEDQSLLAC